VNRKTKNYLTSFPVNDLLWGLLEVKDNIDFAREHNAIRAEWIEVLREGSQIAHSLYKQLYSDRGKSIQLPDPVLDPASVAVWESSDLIELLFYSLVADGIYKIQPDNFSKNYTNTGRFAYGEFKAEEVATATA
jgi:hypothetical protein